MSRLSYRNKANFDWITLWIYISLVCVGWLMIYAVDFKEGIHTTYFDLSTSFGKQLLWIGVATIVVAASIIIHPDFWRTFAYPILIVALIILGLVLIVGQEIKGSQSWFSIGPFSIQPAEVAKFPAILALSSYLAYYNTDLRKTKHFFTAAAIIFLPVTLIMWQPDFGTAITFCALFIVLFRAGANPIWYVLFISAFLLFVSSVIFDDYYVILILVLLGSGLLIRYFSEKLYWFLFMALVVTFVVVSVAMEWFNLAMIMSVLFCGFTISRLFLTKEQGLVFLYVPIIFLASLFSFSTTYVFENVMKPHQQDRINVWLQPELSDPRGSLYNVLQSKMAISSGGLTGKGYLNGTMTKLNYVPEQNTDFIFVTVGEEQGFIGGVAVILLYAILIIRIFLIGERMKNDFDRSFAYGVGSFLFIHFLINIGMTIGVVPVIGIPLPFMSYGGSSLLVFSAMIGVLLRLDMDRRRR